MMEGRKQTEAASRLGGSRRKIAELEEVHKQDTRNIKFLEALVNELFQALEATDGSLPETSAVSTAATFEDGPPALGKTKQQDFTRPPESVPPLRPYNSYDGQSAGR